jgi:hypothetical protein
MKVHISFSLPEDTQDMEAALKAGSYIYRLSELENWIRGKYKHTELTQDQTVLIQELRDLFYSLANEE